MTKQMDAATFDLLLAMCADAAGKALDTCLLIEAITKSIGG